jgi:bacillithiol system protein YtxJ
MGIFNSLFGTNGKKPKQEEKHLAWRRLTKITQLDFLTNESKTKTVLIFKHSTRCSISKMVFRNFERMFNGENYSLYYLDLLAYRELSNEVGFRFQVQHQSPQVIILKSGETVLSTSHYGINEVDYTKV